MEREAGFKSLRERRDSVMVEGSGTGCRGTLGRVARGTKRAPLGSRPGDRPVPPGALAPEGDALRNELAGGAHWASQQAQVPRYHEITPRPGPRPSKAREYSSGRACRGSAGPTTQGFGTPAAREGWTLGHEGRRGRRHQYTLPQ